MSLRVWFFFVVTEAVLCLTPGPAVLFIVSCGLARGGRAALWGNAGILSANTFYFIVSAFGLSAVLLGSHELFTIVKYAGAAYLVWLGIRTIRGAGLAIGTDSQDRPAVDRWRMLARGFVLQAANPKALLFFVALLPQFIDVHRDRTTDDDSGGDVGGGRIRDPRRLRLLRRTCGDAGAASAVRHRYESRQRRIAHRDRHAAGAEQPTLTEEAVLLTTGVTGLNNFLRAPKS